MKIIIWLAFILSTSVLAEDCSKVISEMEKRITQTGQSLEDMTAVELKTLDNIFQPKIRGPHVPYIENNKALYYSKLVPLREQLNKATVSDYRDIVRRLKICEKIATTDNCDKAVVRVDDSSRGKIKENTDSTWPVPPLINVGAVPK